MYCFWVIQVSFSLEIPRHTPETPDFCLFVAGFKMFSSLHHQSHGRVLLISHTLHVWVYYLDFTCSSLFSLVLLKVVLALLIVLLVFFCYFFQGS